LGFHHPTSKEREKGKKSNEWQLESQIHRDRDRPVSFYPLAFHSGPLVVKGATGCKALRRREVPEFTRVNSPTPVTVTPALTFRDAENPQASKELVSTIKVLPNIMKQI